MVDSRVVALEKIGQELEVFTTSPLYAFRAQNKYKFVLGEGDPYANILFIGEAPGEQEARSGRPFVGASGKLLSQFLESIGLERKDVYITNVVKDRPPENRDPTDEEIRLYTPFLIRQIDTIRPKVIVTLGRFAMDFILNLFRSPAAGQKISHIHGSLQQAQAPYGPVWVLPLYHPAVALYNGGQRETLQNDFQVLKQFVGGAEEEA